MFQKGNKLGLGNPYLKKIHALKSIFFEVWTPEEMRIGAEKMKQMAHGGDKMAFEMLCDRTMGRPASEEILLLRQELEERFEALEQKLLGRSGGKSPVAEAAAN